MEPSKLQKCPHKSWYSGLGLRSHTLFIPYESLAFGCQFQRAKKFQREKLQDYLLCDTLEYFCFNLSIHSFSILLIVDICIIPLKVLDVFYFNYILTCTPLFVTGLSVCKIKWTMPHWVSRTMRLQFWRLQWTSTTHQCTIHWMLTITQLWMDLNWVNIWFHLGNQFLQKYVSCIER